MELEIRPISLKDANDFVIKNHRHNKSVTGHKYSISCYQDEKLVGVAIVGRPISRFLDDGLTLEINRCCTDGTKNACSKLYSSCCRIAKEMGYKKIITYILMSEYGSSLKASNFHLVKENCGGDHWTGERYKKIENELFPEYEDKKPKEYKKLYERIL